MEICRVFSQITVRCEHFNVKKSVDVHHLLVDAYGERSYFVWFHKFKNRELVVENKKRSATIIGGRFMPDARNTCTSIENYSTSSFTSFEIVGNNEKAEKLGLK